MKFRICIFSSPTLAINVPVTSFYMFLVLRKCRIDFIKCIKCRSNSIYCAEYTAEEVAENSRRIIIKGFRFFLSLFTLEFRTNFTHSTHTFRFTGNWMQCGFDEMIEHGFCMQTCYGNEWETKKKEEKIFFFIFTVSLLVFTYQTTSCKCLRSLFG